MAAAGQAGDRGLRGKAIWVALPGLASASLLALGLCAAAPPRPVEGPLPPVMIGRGAPTGMTVSLADDPSPRAAMRPLPARINGRAGLDGKALIHQWPAFHATARFRGCCVAVALDDAENRYLVTMDGAEIGLTRLGAALVEIAGLSDGPHEIRLEKLSERADPGRFLGFYLPPGGTALPLPPAPPLIEIVGDSDSVGYGNTAPGRDCSAEAQYLATDTSLAFGPMAARALGADYRVIAASGIGLVRNLGGGRENAMRDVYPAAVPALPDAPRASEPAPDVIVIALGSNDFAKNPDLPEDREARLRLREDFAAGLLAFMKDRRAEAPEARLVLLAFGEYGRDLVRAHRQAREDFLAGGDRADLLVLPELARTGCHWHPSLNDHQVIAQRLVSLLSPR